MSKENEYGKFTIGNLVYDSEYKKSGILVGIDTTEFMPKFLVEFKYGLNKEIEKYNYNSLQVLQSKNELIKILINDLLKVDFPNISKEEINKQASFIKRIDIQQYDAEQNKKLYENNHPEEFENKYGFFPKKDKYEKFTIKSEDEYFKISERVAIEEYVRFNDLPAWRAMLELNKELSYLKNEEKQLIIEDLKLDKESINKLEKFSIQRVFCNGALNYYLEHNKNQNIPEIKNENKIKVIKKEQDKERI